MLYACAIIFDVMKNLKTRLLLGHMQAQTQEATHQTVGFRVMVATCEAPRLPGPRHTRYMDLYARLLP